MESLEVSPVLAGSEVHEQWLKRLKPCSPATAKQAASRSAQLARCYMSSPMLPDEVAAEIRPATAETQKAFAELVQLYHAHEESQAGQYGMFLLAH